MSDFNFFIPIAKVDKDKRTVSGYASTPTKDSDGEIVTLEAIRNALPDYMEYGNIREMHALKAVGVAKEANIDAKGLYLTAKIVDNNAWEKCLEGVYKGFSIGGRKLEKEGDSITAIDLTEISVVDRPANPDCRMALAKSEKKLGDAEGYLLKIKGNRSPEQKALSKMAKVVEALTKGGPPAAHDGFSLPVKAAAENPSPKDDSEQNNKAEGLVPCVAHGKVGCKKCAGAKAKKKAAKKLAKAKLAEDLGLGQNNFLTLRKDDSEPFDKSMRTAGSLSYCFDSLRDVQRSLIMEAKREGGDGKDKALAKQVGTIAKQLAGIISQKATHEGEEALDLSDGDDKFLASILGEESEMDKTMDNDELSKAVAELLKRGTEPNFAKRMEMAKEDVRKARKAMKECRKTIEEAHAMHKAAYLSKAKKADKKPKDDDDEDDGFDHAGAMEKLQKAYGDLDKARTFGKAAMGNIAKAESIPGRSGQRGQEAGDGEAGFYEVPAGVKDMSPAAMSGAKPGTTGTGGQPPQYPLDGGVYPGKAEGIDDLAKYARNGVVPVEVVELVMANARATGELEALRRLPANASGRRPYAFDLTKVTGGNTTPTDLNKALFDGVDPSALNSGDELAHTQASAKIIGNFLTSGHFGKSVLDATFKGAAGTSR